MSFQIARHSTIGQQRRRAAYLERRKAARGGTTFTAARTKRTRRSFKEWRAFRKANREQVGGWIARIQERFADWRSRSASRCPYVRIYKEKGIDVAGDPCGGRLRAYRVRSNAVAVQRCEKCGRSWQAHDGRMVAA